MHVYNLCRGYAVTVIMRTLMGQVVCATIPGCYSISGILIVIIINWIMRTMTVQMYQRCSMEINFVH